MRDDRDGKAEEVKGRDKKDKDETKRGKTEAEEGGERVGIDRKRVCFGFCSNLTS